MAIKDMGWDLKNALLESVFKKAGTYYIEARNHLGSPVSEKVSFAYNNAGMGTGVSNGEIGITSPVSLAVPKAGVSLSNAKVYHLWVYNGETLTVKIELEGNEIKDFSSEEAGGIYQINTLKITM